MKQRGFKKFVLRTLLALTPVIAYVGLYLVMDPFKVVHRYNGISVEPGDTLERIPNKRYVAVEGLKYYNDSLHYDSFIFGSSLSSNFSVDAWKKHLPDTASVYHFTAGAEPLEGIRDELRYLFDNHVNVRHVLLVMEEEMYRRGTRYEEMPYVPHYDVSPKITWLDFQRVHFNAFRDPDILLYQFFPSLVASKLVEDGKMQTVPSGGRNELANEDLENVLDSIIISDPDKYFSTMPWLVEMQPLPDPMPLSIGAKAEATLREIADMLNEHHVDYLVIVPPRFRTQPLLPLDHALLCEIMGEEHVNDFSGDSTLIHDLHSYYDGLHILTYRCSELIDRCYENRRLPHLK